MKSNNTRLRTYKTQRIYSTSASIQETELVNFNTRYTNTLPELLLETHKKTLPYNDINIVISIINICNLRENFETTNFKTRNLVTTKDKQALVATIITSQTELDGFADKKSGTISFSTFPPLPEKMRTSSQCEKKRKLRHHFSFFSKMCE